jgi:hypothetical protein
MKKVFLAIAVASVFTACNNGESTETKTDTTVVTKDTTTVLAPVVKDTVTVKDTLTVKKDTTKKM